MRPFYLLPLLTIACAETQSDHVTSRVIEDDAPVALELATRAGEATTGWSFDAHAIVPTDEANLFLSSTDCGARGRWVTLHAEGVQLGLSADAATRSRLEIGGSDATVAVGDTVYVEHADGSVTSLLLQDRTGTPFDWYLADDLSFEVILEIL